MSEKNIIRVLHVAQAAGGVDRYLRMLLKYMDKEKFENILVCSYDYKCENYSEIADAFEYVDMKRSIDLSDLKAVLEVRKLIKKYKPDIVYAHSSKAGAIARLADLGIYNKCVYNPHGWAFNMRESKKKQDFYVLIEKVMALFCNKIICISEAEKESALSKKICSKDKLSVVYNGVDIEQFEMRSHSSLSRKNVGIPEGAFVVGMVGRLCPQKAPDVFIKAAKRILKDIPKAYFVIVGNGNLEKDIRYYAESSGFDNSLLITGWVDNPMEYIELFDVALLLSRWEGFGLVLPEYMLAGKPIIATRVDAIPNIIIEQKNGILVESDNVEAVHSAVLELYTDEKLRKRLIEKAKDDVYNKFDARRVAKEQCELFLQLLDV